MSGTRECMAASLCIGISSNFGEKRVRRAVKPGTPAL